MKDVTWQTKMEVVKDFISDERFCDELTGAETDIRDLDSRVVFWAGLWQDLAFCTTTKSALKVVGNVKKVAKGEVAKSIDAHDESVGPDAAGADAVVPEEQAAH